MICPECGASGAAPRQARCGACSYEFVFQPEADGTSDAEWLELVARTSSQGRYFFTVNQLYCQYARGRVVVTRYISKRGRLGLLMIVVGLGMWMYALKVDWGLTLVCGIAITLIGVAQVGTGVVTRREPASREPLLRWLGNWLAQKPLAKLLRATTLAHAGLELCPARVECLLIVERDALVDLLLKNDAHQQLSALILSEAGYPERLVPEARRLLDERSDLKVIALHDATQRGISLKSRLQASPSLPLLDRPIVDAGLFAAEVGQIEALTSAFPASHTTQVPVDALSYPALVAGLASVSHGALSISTGIFEATDTRHDTSNGERAA